jgi:hypothetical protein
MNHQYATESSSSNVSKKSSEPSFGFRLGLQSVAVGNSDYLFSSTFVPRIGILGGITSFIPIGKTIDLRPGLIYTSKGAQYADYDNIYLALNYIEIPVDIAFKLGSGGFALNAGPYLAFLTKAKNYDLSGDEIDLNTYFASPTYNGG